MKIIPKRLGVLPIDLFKKPCYLLVVLVGRLRKVNGFRKPTKLVAALKPI